MDGGCHSPRAGMANVNQDEFWKELDATGEEDVRKKSAAGVYGNWKHDLVLAWLAKQQTAATVAMESRHADAAEKTSFWAKVAAIAAIVMIPVTCIGIWVSNN